MELCNIMYWNIEHWLHITHFGYICGCSNWPLRIFAQSGILDIDICVIYKQKLIDDIKLIIHRVGKWESNIIKMR